MHWRKLGRVFCPAGERDWMRSHAAVPIAQPVGGSVYRVYFSSRDAANRSHTGYAVFDLNRPSEVLELSSSPVLSPGALGAFDDSGAMATWIARHGGQHYLYYIGWNLGVTVPFRNAIGLAMLDSRGKATRVAQGPIVDRTMQEPHFCASCCVIPGSDFWRMWYLSCTGWTEDDGGPKHHYHIKYATSDDGIRWRREGLVAIDYQHPAEFAISRPSVLRDGEVWKMWYSTRGEAYRIGYAESGDGCSWRRLDHRAGIAPSAAGWDAEMIEYPFVFDHEGARYMLYNGNGFGKTGFGLAVLEGQ
ncbi:MAG TPA: hypothetical protein VFV84_15000 [Burkholderiales bacterium]|nr:hypothetical protein [Burkholderiales bacterium]